MMISNPNTIKPLAIVSIGYIQFLISEWKFFPQNILYSNFSYNLFYTLILFTVCTFFFLLILTFVCKLRLNTIIYGLNLY